MSVLVHRETGEARPAGHAGTGYPHVAAPARRPRRGEPRRPPTRVRVVAGHPHAPVRSCAPRPVARRWPWLLALAAAVFAAVVGLGLLANGLAAGGAATVPERTVLVPVAPGETLWDVAVEFAPDSDPGAVVERIEELNGLSGPAVEAGTPLLVPHQGVTSARP
ncbi:LysM peptidoglycan-binding domain-containing protein [Qaidamihabitans albus]|uniref:LysM peptidoglycan-binding domain-containing protein n=1 Tax=Qaidamihabitans albus TaxID=2795733 RepID=UPI0018F18F4F|nr:LysM peptidoglycan-binding domain-containing protein [Qaidamihabitans albus]